MSEEQKTEQVANPRGEKIRKKEQAERELDLVMLKVQQARLACNVVFPNDHERTINAQRKAYYRYLMLYGQALGELVAFFRTGVLDEVGYSYLRQKVVNTLAAEVIGAVGPGGPYG